jgi:predicted PurR-regulated permease PerM
MANEHSDSPPWNNTIKLVVALSFIGIFVLFMIFYRQIVGPLILAFILSYLVHPLASKIRRFLKIPWRLSVTLIYLVIVLILLGLLTGSGLVVITQIQNLINFLQVAIKDLPTYIDQLSHQKYYLGPFLLDLSKLDLTALGNQLLSMIEGLFSQAGYFLGNVATGAASTIGWTFFVLFVSYFILAETEGSRSRLFHFRIPGYEEDGKRMSTELGRIWNSFLRNQLIIIGIVFVIYTIFLGGIGLHYYLGLALLAGMARFLPYIGPFIVWSTYGLVAYFQGSTIFGISPLVYALVVIGGALIIDMIMDNIVYYRLMGDALNAHPAAVMVAVIIGLNWLGVIGVVLAAPVLATMVLLGDYALRKMFDQDPWEALDQRARQNRRKKKSNTEIQLKKIRSWVTAHFPNSKQRKKDPGQESVIKEEIAQNSIKNGDIK